MILIGAYDTFFFLMQHDFGSLGTKQADLLNQTTKPTLLNLFLLSEYSSFF